MTRPTRPRPSPVQPSHCQRGPVDNRRLEARPDVLTFTGDPQDADLEVIGPVRVLLYVQASVPYIDVHARLCDVTSRGRSINISDGIVRLADAAADTPHPVEFDLWPVAHAFRRGHRIRLQVSGGAHPRYGRNLGTAEPFASTRLQASDAHCSTMPSTPLQCGYLYAADLQCRLPPIYTPCPWI